MYKVYTPSTTTLKLSAAGFAVIALVAVLCGDGGAVFGIGFVALLILFVQWVYYIPSYEKFVVTDNSLLIKSYFDQIKTEINYQEIGKVFFHSGTARQGTILSVDAPVEEISLWMKDGTSIRLNTTPIDDSGELFALLKSRVEGS